MAADYEHEVDIKAAAEAAHVLKSALVEAFNRNYQTGNNAEAVAAALEDLLACMVVVYGADEEAMELLVGAIPDALNPEDEGN